MKLTGKYCVAGALALAVAVGVLLSARPVEAPPRAAPAPDSRPATQPAQNYPPDDLVAACEAEARRLGRRLDESFNVAVAPPFVVAGNCTSQRLNAYVKWSVVRPAEAMWKSYFEKKPTGVITILLFSDGRSYRQWAKRLFGDTNLPHFGYCRSDGTLVMNIATGTGTLVHELTHGLIKYDFPAVPDWFNEGLASLHEQCSVGDDRIVGHVNWRLPGLQKALKAGKLRPLRELVTARDFYGRLKGLNYAQARYFVMYMQQRGVLGEFYETFRDLHADGGRSRNPKPEARNLSSSDAAVTRPAPGHGRDAPAASIDVTAIEQTLGRGIDEIDKDFRKWVLTLRFPRGR